MEELDEKAMRKAGRSKAFQEILDLLTLDEMEGHKPKPAAAPPGPADEMSAAAKMGEESPGGAMPPMDSDDAADGGLTPEEIEELQMKLEKMKE